MTHLHPQCPASLAHAPATLSAGIVEDVIGFLVAEQYDRMLALHNYSEPLIDPRLFTFLGSIKTQLPACGVYILTNGWALDQILLDELFAAGVAQLRVSAYSDSESERLSGLDGRGHTYEVVRVQLDKRLTHYDRKPQNCRKPCHEPLEHLLVRCTGEVVLCCRDWKSQTVFGDLRKETLKDVLSRPEIWATWERLRQGDRFLPLCQRCACERKTRVPA